MSAPALLDLRNIRVMRGENIVLDNLSLRIEAGEHVAILGPNGCGKSTLVKTITRECYPVARDESSMTILGRDRWDVFELRSMMGIISNDLMLACTYAVRTSAQVTDLMHRMAGTSGIYASSRLERHLRDALTVRHHGFLAESRLETVGQIYLGVEPEFALVAF